MLHDFLRALGQWADPRFRRVVWLGLLLALALLIGVYALMLAAIEWLVPATVVLPWAGEVGGLATFLSLGGLIVMIVLSPLLMMPVASAFTGFFLDDVAQAVEDRHYPALPPAADVPLYDQIKDGVNYFALLVAVNILGLGVFLFSGPFALPVFWGLNGFLLGREYFQMVAMRRLGRTGASDMRGRYPLTVWTGGVLMALPLSVPVLNLFVPVIGVAGFTHLFHRLRRQEAAASGRTSRYPGR
ncbi:EI24 domain-containing protein [Halodurantibacterium flavum]|uniref:EI24 domain-containing protein n=1 Tax=Halodurantibacterium flavum TaxID=1382802 RepID=A0ABW4S238_9RHOB